MVWYQQTIPSTHALFFIWCTTNSTLPWRNRIPILLLLLSLWKAVLSVNCKEAIHTQSTRSTSYPSIGTYNIYTSSDTLAPNLQPTGDNLVWLWSWLHRLICSFRECHALNNPTTRKLHIVCCCCCHQQDTTTRLHQLFSTILSSLSSYYSWCVYEGSIHLQLKPLLPNYRLLLLLLWFDGGFQLLQAQLG
jgi:hypothetical protein